MQLNFACWEKPTFKFLAIAVSVLWLLLFCFSIREFSLLHGCLYSLFSISFFTNLLLSGSFVVEKRRGFFFFFISLIFFAGFFVKFSVHTILKYPYVEPVGNYRGTPSELTEFLIVCIVGSLGLLASQFFAPLLFDKVRLKKLGPVNVVTSKKSKKLLVGILFLVSTFLAIINLQKNIMIFGLLPSVELPLKGNVIFFLLLTRGIVFLFFYFLPRKFDLVWVVTGSLLCLISSTGVLSRMLLIIYFAVIFLDILINWRDHKHPWKNFTFLVVLFFLASYLNVITTIQLRLDVYEKFDARTKNIEMETIANGETGKKIIYEKVYKKKRLVGKAVGEEKKSAYTTSKFERYSFRFMKLFVERWIGVEGVMSVVGHNGKSLQFFKEAWGEGSYQGISIYKKIANPEHYKLMENKKRRVKVSTSVSGPIAFFYYSGSFMVVFLGMSIFTGFLYGLEWGSVVLGGRQPIVAFAAAIMAFDFFQFGISPFSFFKYLGFTIFCIYSFLYFFPVLKRKTAVKKV